ncbi:MAG: serine hydrolase domain-containing protein [Pseudonocardiaceae bacterium]
MPTWLIRLISRVFLGLFAGCVAVLVVNPVAKAEWAPRGCANPAPAVLAGFFDDALPRWLARDRVPGAVVSVVSGGNTVFAKGHGQADVQRGVAFDASRSLVRIASITKLFTATAVMQQVEAGRLDLNADVNRYLKAFQIPSTYPEPVTLQTLMDHTAGFEDRFIGTGAPTAADVPALGDYLAAHIPARIRPPGEISAYSNYGAALAGYIVTQVSGAPYDHYVQRHLFDPLGMTRSTATEPVPGTLASDLAHSYDSDTSPLQSVLFWFDPMTPDGAISTTAADMTHFMIAHLHEGRFGNASILAPASVAEMHERSFTADPRLDGYAHGFKERTINGHRILMHDGSWEGFQSALMLVPGCDFGLFVSTNGTGGLNTLPELEDTFFDRFAPAAAIPGTASAATRTTAATAQAGFYEPARHNESTIEKLLTLLDPIPLTVGGDSTVHFDDKNWTPQETVCTARSMAPIA